LHCRDDIDFINKIVDSTALERLQQVAATPFERVSYSRAIELLEEAVRAKKKKFEYKARAAGSLLCMSRAERPNFIDGCGLSVLQPTSCMDPLPASCACA
jgi:aspartyl/asparaginyl-tRNA synthetase